MTKKLQYQQEKINELLNLIKENPDLMIVPMVDSELVADDGFNWWMGSWGKAEVDEIYISDERVHLRSADEDSLIDEICDNLDNFDDRTAEEAYELAKEEVSQYKWQKVITVSINLPVLH